MGEQLIDVFQNMLLSLTLKNIASGGCALAMMIGGVIPYVPQYREIQVSLNADGFSPYVCLTLLIANTLRIVFWFGHSFEYPLLLQSFIMNIAMLAMVHLSVTTRNQTQIVPVKPHLFMGEDKTFHSLPSTPTISTHNFWDFDARYFWEWTDFLSYVEFLATFTAMTGILMYFFIDVSWFVEVVGFLAVFTEAMLGAPQFCRNIKKKSTVGMSKKMVVLWTIGDVFKTVYFVLRQAPLQFWVCGILQVVLDILILAQVLIYKASTDTIKLLVKGAQHIS